VEEQRLVKEIYIYHLYSLWAVLCASNHPIVGFGHLTRIFETEFSIQLYQFPPFPRPIVPMEDY
jgi:hypothetical protein